VNAFAHVDAQLETLVTLAQTNTPMFQNVNSFTQWIQIVELLAKQISLILLNCTV